MNPYSSEDITIASQVKKRASKLPKRYEFGFWLLPICVPLTLAKALDLSIFSETYINVILPSMFVCFFGFYLATSSLAEKLRVKRCIAYFLFCLIAWVFHRYLINEIAASV